MVDYTSRLRAELRYRVANWTIDLSREHEYLVLGGLAARQVTLATQLARAPSTWNEHAAPLFLRSMLDVLLSIKWICAKPGERAPRFLAHGLGQAKLIKEHRKDVNAEDPAVAAMEEWIGEFKIDPLVEVNVGAWSDLDTRKMAEEVGERDLYRLAFSPFSSCVHSTFDHVGRFNLTRTANPLHRFVSVPVVPDFPIEPHYLLIAAKYVRKTWATIDGPHTKASPEPSASDVLYDALCEASDNGDPKEGAQAPRKLPLRGHKKGSGAGRSRKQ